MLQNRVLPPLRNKPYGGAWSIHDPVSLDYLKSIAPEKGNRKEILHDDLLFTKVGWIYQYNAIPNNKENKLTNYFMKKTYEQFYGELDG